MQGGSVELYGKSAGHIEQLNQAGIIGAVRRNILLPANHDNVIRCGDIYL